MSDIPKGTVAGLGYVAIMNEDDWLPMPQERKDEHHKFWYEDATERGCKTLSLVLRPDPIFPATGRKQQYVYKTDKVEQPSKYNHTVSCIATITLEPGIAYDFEYKRALREQVSKYPKYTAVFVRVQTDDFQETELDSWIVK